MNIRIIVFFVALFYSQSIFSQIMNIENVRIKNDTTGMDGTVELSFQYIKNTKELLTTGSKIHLQYKTEKSLYLLLTNYSLAKSGSTEYADAGSLHLRYNYKFKPWLTAEIFTQLQYNNSLNISSRWLNGIGPRSKIMHYKSFVLYAAVLYMYEYEKLKDPEIINKDNRLSAYISFTLKINDILNFIYTCYYQPKIVDFNDFRIASYADLKVKISKNFYLKISHFYSFDTNPAATIPKSTHSISNAISYSF
ncbi:MAG: DUF481 domain-containing protein [Saprospiraceae bacterium]